MVLWRPPPGGSRNYGPTIAVQNVALQKGCQQVLWLYGEQEEITEVGTMNLFIYWTAENGGQQGGWAHISRIQSIWIILELRLSFLCFKIIID